MTVDGAAILGVIPSMMTRSIQKQQEIPTGKKLSWKKLTGKKWKEEEDRVRNCIRRKREDVNVKKTGKKVLLFKDGS